MLFRAGAAILTVVFLHGAGNLERDANALVANAGSALADASLPAGVSSYCQSAPGTCLAIARQAGSGFLLRDDAALHTASKTPGLTRPELVAPVIPLAGDSILPPRRKSRLQGS